MTLDKIDRMGEGNITLLIAIAKYKDTEDIDLRCRAIGRLGEIKSFEAIPTIVDALNSGRETIEDPKAPYWKVRTSAAESLSHFHTNLVVNPLKQALHLENDITVRTAIVKAVGTLSPLTKDKDILKMLINQLELVRDNGLAKEICWALGRLGDKKAFDALMAVKKGRYLDVVKQAAKEAILELDFDAPSILDGDKSDF